MAPLTLWTGHCGGGVLYPVEWAAAPRLPPVEASSNPLPPLTSCISQNISCHCRMSPR